MEFSELIIPVIFFAVLSCLLIVLVVLKKKLSKNNKILGLVVSHISPPIKLFVLVSALYVIYKIVLSQWSANSAGAQIYSIAGVICLGWLITKALNLICSLLLNHFDIRQTDNYRARKVHTQIRVFQRLAYVFVVILVIVGILVTFEAVRSQGLHLLASAGIISVLIGLAAQKTIGTFFSGLQIAIAQPIRVDDVVMLENEWGRIEEIHLTFVIVKLWDLRRLIVPISYFTDHVFQNWTRKTAEILGTVMLHVDYTVPVQLIRDELDTLLEGNALWDGKVKVVQVTNTTEKTMEVRILTSSANSGASFDLACVIREHMITFVNRKQIEISKEKKPQEQVTASKEEPVRAPAPTLDAQPKPMDPKSGK